MFSTPFAWVRIAVRIEHLDAFRDGENRSGEMAGDVLHLANWPAAVDLVLAIIVLDPVIYGQHVLFHAVPFLEWRAARRSVPSAAAWPSSSAPT